VAVTGLTAGLSALADLSLGRAALVTAAVLAGQLTIGWSNDSLDAGRDIATARPDKPVAQGVVSRRTVGVAAGAALVATVGLSVALGPAAGSIAVLVALCGIAYNIGLKATVCSWLPYAVAFGLLPAIATRARPDQQWPSGWAVATGVLLGVAAHFANVLPDLADDDATGVRGLPQRLGARVCAATGPGLLFVAGVVIVGGSVGFGPVGWATVIVAALVASGAVIASWVFQHSRLYFMGFLILVLGDIALFVGFGVSIT
jgi:4-hydroxybenzoate polyprenyltransferase